MPGTPNVRGARVTSVLWRRRDVPGAESARLERHGTEWHLAGMVVVRGEREPCAFQYRVVCDERWRTRRATVAGWADDGDVRLEIEVDSVGGWHLNGSRQDAVADCVDLDLAFTPSTNLLPIRRLRLAVGESASVRTAWLRFPGLRFEALDQVYFHEGERRYRYESGGGRFTACLDVDEHGMVQRYGDLWTAG